jgi:hypothetical protein
MIVIMVTKAMQGEDKGLSRPTSKHRYSGINQQ